MKTYLIDYENVNSSGLNGIDRLKEGDRVIIFYSEKCNTLTFDAHRKIGITRAAVEYHKAPNGRKNSLDFQLSTYLGYLLAREPERDYIVVSHDEGYRSALRFWRFRNYSVTMASAIGSPALSDEALLQGQTAPVTLQPSQMVPTPPSPVQASPVPVQTVTVQEVPAETPSAPEAKAESGSEAANACETKETDRPAEADAIIADVSEADVIIADVSDADAADADVSDADVSDADAADADVSDADVSDADAAEADVIIADAAKPVHETRKRPAARQRTRRAKSQAAQAQTVQAQSAPSAPAQAQAPAQIAPAQIAHAQATQVQAQAQAPAKSPAKGENGNTLAAITKAELLPRLTALLPDCSEEDINRIATCLKRCHTKQTVNNSLVRSFGNDRTSVILKAIRPLLAGMKGSNATAARAKVKEVEKPEAETAAK